MISDEAEIGEGEKFLLAPAGSVYRCGIGGNARDYRRRD